MASSSSSLSSSILSAKARPFIPPQPQPTSSSSQSTLSAKAPPFTKPNNTKSQSSPFIGEPYYPIYDSLLDSDFVGFDAGCSSSTYNGDDVLEPSCDFEGVSVGPWNAPFDQEVGQLDESGVISSSWMLPSLDPQGTRPKLTVIPFKVSGTSTSAVSSQLSILTSSMESWKASNSASCYNDSLVQICTSAAKPVASHPDGSAQVYVSSAQATSSILDSLSKTVNRGYIWPEASTTSQKAKHEEVLDRRRACNITGTSTGFGDCSTMREGPSSDFIYESSLAKPLEPHKISTSKMSKNKNDSLKNSSETLDQLGLDVDSPCWKGTFAHQRSPFSVDEAAPIDLTAVKSVSGADVAKGLPHIPNNVTDIMKDQGRKSEVLGKEKLQLDQEVTVSFTNHLKTADDITISNYSHEDAAENSSSNSHAKAIITTPAGTTIESYGSDLLLGKASFMGEYEQIIDGTLQCLRKRLLSRAYRDKRELNGLLNEVLLLVDDYPKACVYKNEKGIVSGHYDDPGPEAARSQGRVLKAPGHTVIHQSKDGKWDARGIANGCYDDFGSEFAPSLDRVLRCQGHAVMHQSKIDGIWDAKGDTIPIPIQSNFKTSHDSEIQGEMQPIGRYTTTHLQAVTGGNFHEYVPEFAESQDFEKILKNNFHEHEDNFRSLLHKNLWIEAEARLLSMKYELRLACAEIEILKHRQCAQDRIQEVDSFPSLNYQALNPLIDERENNLKFDQHMNKREMKDAFPISRFGALRIKN